MKVTDLTPFLQILMGLPDFKVHASIITNYVTIKETCFFFKTKYVESIFF